MPACATLADRHPLLQRDIGRQRQRSRIVDMFGGNADRLQRQKGDGCYRQQLAHPRQIGLADQDVGFQRQMRAMLSVAAGGSTAIQRAVSALAPALAPALAISGQWISVQSRAERLKSSEAFLMNLRGSLLDIPGT
jgi:hypothetical protein